VQQNLRTLPQELVKSHADHVEVLDLSHNCLKDLSWLSEFEQLRHLVLDNNRMHEITTKDLTYEKSPGVVAFWAKVKGI